MTLLPRTWMFTPGSRPDRFDKAVATSADAVILDLEDAVLEAEKPQARDHVLAFLKQRARGSTRIVVRINSVRRRVGIEDLIALTGSEQAPDYILLPKVEEPADLGMVADVMTDAGCGSQLIALLESARGVANAAAIASASSRLNAIMFGAADYAADLGLQVQTMCADHARGTIANACAAAGIIAIDSPHFSLDDMDSLETESRMARSIGFFGKALVHPKQLPVIEAVFNPTPQERALAERILQSSATGVSIVEGKMVDVAMVRWAQRIAQPASTA